MPVFTADQKFYEIIWCECHYVPGFISRRKIEVGELKLCFSYSTFLALNNGTQFVGIGQKMLEKRVVKPGHINFAKNRKMRDGHLSMI